ncbi:MAG: DUF3276 family protein [Bacteroidales bacterium]|nr:DUF3276 family protein [Bacteroidales bacterium]
MELHNNREREELFSKVVKAGKRTYFFDVKETRAGDKFITITESRKNFDDQTGRFYYEKSKMFLYPEDFEKFANGLNVALKFVETGEVPEEPEEEPKMMESTKSDDEKILDDISSIDVNF